MTKSLSTLRRLELFLSSARGKRILNYFYSWGAAFVILGALFKLLHIRYGDEIVFASMLTEVVVFIVLGFERPEESGSKASSPSDKIEIPVAHTQVEATSPQPYTSPERSPLPLETPEGVSDQLEAIHDVYVRQLSELRAQLVAMEQINVDLQHMRSMYEAGAKDSTTVRRENERLIAQLEQLNAAYARMLQAMTVNMHPLDSHESTESSLTK